MLVPLDRSAGLAAHSNHKKACFDVNLKKLEGHALLIWYERQVAFTAMKRRWRSAADGNVDDNGLNDFRVSDC